MSADNLAERPLVRRSGLRLLGDWGEWVPEDTELAPAQANDKRRRRRSGRRRINAERQRREPPRRAMGGGDGNTALAERLQAEIRRKQARRLASTTTEGAKK